MGSSRRPDDAHQVSLPTRRASHFAPCLDLPALSSPSVKNISVFQKYNLRYMICHPVPLRGALRNVINAGRGCGGRGRADRRSALKRTAKACGPDIAVLVSSLSVKTRKATVAKEPFTGEITL